MANGIFAKTVIGIGASAVIAVTTFNGSKIDRNKDTNEHHHNVIMETMIKRDEKLAESVHRFDVRQEVLIKTVDKYEVLLERIHSKL